MLPWGNFLQKAYRTKLSWWPYLTGVSNSRHRQKSLPRNRLTNTDPYIFQPPNITNYIFVIFYIEDSWTTNTIIWTKSHNMNKNLLPDSATWASINSYPSPQESSNQMTTCFLQWLELSLRGQPEEEVKFILCPCTTHINRQLEEPSKNFERYYHRTEVCSLVFKGIILQENVECWAATNVLKTSIY